MRQAKSVKRSAIAVDASLVTVLASFYCVSQLGRREDYIGFCRSASGQLTHDCFVGLVAFDLITSAEFICLVDGSINRKAGGSVHAINIHSLILVGYLAGAVLIQTVELREHKADDYESQTDTMG